MSSGGRHRPSRPGLSYRSPSNPTEQGGRRGGPEHGSDRRAEDYADAFEPMYDDEDEDEEPDYEADVPVTPAARRGLQKFQTQPPEREWVTPLSAPHSRRRSGDADEPDAFAIHHDGLVTSVAGPTEYNRSQTLWTAGASSIAGAGRSHSRENPRHSATGASAGFNDSSSSLGRSRTSTRYDYQSNRSAARPHSRKQVHEAHPEMQLERQHSRPSVNDGRTRFSKETRHGERVSGSSSGSYQKVSGWRSSSVGGAVGPRSNRESGSASNSGPNSREGSFEDLLSTANADLISDDEVSDDMDFLSAPPSAVDLLTGRSAAEKSRRRESYRPAVKSPAADSSRSQHSPAQRRDGGDPPARVPTPLRTPDRNRAHGYNSNAPRSVRHPDVRGNDDYVEREISHKRSQVHRHVAPTGSLEEASSSSSSSSPVTRRQLLDSRPASRPAGSMDPRRAEAYGRRSASEEEDDSEIEGERERGRERRGEVGRRECERNAPRRNSEEAAKGSSEEELDVEYEVPLPRDAERNCRVVHRARGGGSNDFLKGGRGEKEEEEDEEEAEEADSDLYEEEEERDEAGGGGNERGREERLSEDEEIEGGIVGISDGLGQLHLLSPLQGGVEREGEKEEDEVEEEDEDGTVQEGGEEEGEGEDEESEIPQDSLSPVPFDRNLSLQPNRQAEPEVINLDRVLSLQPNRPVPNRLKPNHENLIVPGLRSKLGEGGISRSAPSTGNVTPEGGQKGGGAGSLLRPFTPDFLKRKQLFPPSGFGLLRKSTTLSSSTKKPPRPGGNNNPSGVTKSPPTAISAKGIPAHLMPQNLNRVASLPKNFEYDAMAAPKRTHFQLSELELATDNFSSSTILGQGGFGTVYKGVLPVKPKQVIAVKLLKKMGSQGDEEFTTELELLSRLEHKHLVKLLGFCITPHKRVLVYQFLPNGSLFDHMHGKYRKYNGPLSWERRLKIAVGSARGIRHLHSQRPQVLHRDIKATNILLTNSFDAKVADFGCAKLLKNRTSVRSKTGLTQERFVEFVDVGMGTVGHMAPEVLMSGEISAASDMYSFGVVLLEIVSGREPVWRGEGNQAVTLASWAQPLLEERKWEEIVDPFLLESKGVPKKGQPSPLVSVSLLALACLNFDPLMRPPIEIVAHTLQGIFLDKDMSGHSSIIPRSQTQDSSLSNSSLSFYSNYFYSHESGYSFATGSESSGGSDLQHTGSSHGSYEPECTDENDAEYNNAPLSRPGTAMSDEARKKMMSLIEEGNDESIEWGTNLQSVKKP